ncbi:hypothetical protein [Moorena sp. SIO3I8]|nr:hypothetical protein [Moorena sp. SIO3I8]
MPGFYALATMNSEGCFVVSICATRTLREQRSAVSRQPWPQAFG